VSRRDLFYVSTHGSVTVLGLSRADCSLPPGGVDTSQEFNKGHDGAWFRWLAPSSIRAPSARMYAV